MIEVLVAASVIAVAFGSTLVGFTHMNRTASISRNSTGAYTMAVKQIDGILSVGPFNPQKKIDPNCVDGILICPRQIPPELVPTADGSPRSEEVPIYNDAPMVGGVFKLLSLTDPPTFAGIMETEVKDVSPTPNSAPYFYRATVTVCYQYRGRGPIWSPKRNRWEYQLKMSTLRTSDI